MSGERLPAKKRLSVKLVRCSVFYHTLKIFSWASINVKVALRHVGGTIVQNVFSSRDDLHFGCVSSSISCRIKDVASLSFWHIICRSFRPLPRQDFLWRHCQIWQQPFLMLVQPLETQRPLTIGMSHFCQVAGKHSPAVCNALSACSAKVLNVFWHFGWRSQDISWVLY